MRILAFGQGAPTLKSDLAIGHLTIGGTVQNAIILAGHINQNGVYNAGAQIGNVTVGGDWIDSRLSAGVESGADGLGTANDARYNVALATRDEALTSRIASITIGGQVRSADGISGFAAEEVVAMKVHGQAVRLTSGASNDTFAGAKVHPPGSSLSAVNSDGFAAHVYEI